VRADRLVLVHGFTQTARSWDPIVARLGDVVEAVAVDAPGHGSAADVVADLWQAADHVVAAGGRGTYVGYSMGARICLHAALAHASAIERLVLVSGTAGIEDPAERASRRRADEELAASIERDGVDAFLKRWLDQPLFASLPVAARQVEDRRRNTAAGLASSLRHAGTGTQEPVWLRLPELAMPVLLVVGAADAKFRALAERMHALIPDAGLAVVPGAGHTAHLEAPDTFVELLTTWLGRHPI
jgi:2-succinyl-6-hydroxy-2,4-cyclohexadiene-1-carboxylate synthase